MPVPLFQRAAQGQLSPANAIRSGFTLIELIVLLLVITVGILLVLPAVLKAREAARNAHCKDNLRQIGVAMHAYAAADPQGRFCSGAIDAIRDGCPDTYGWAADVYQVKGLRASVLKCPASPIRGIETLNDLLGSNAAKGTSAPADRLNKGFCAKLPPVSSPPTGAEIAARSRIIAPVVREMGLNTNYAQSWHACRGAPQAVTVGTGSAAQIYADPNPAAPTGFNELRNVKGPLTQRQVDTADVPSNSIPLLGDAARSNSANPNLISNLLDARGISGDADLQRGAPLGRSFNSGPAMGPGGSAREPAIMPITTAVPVWALFPAHFPTVGEVVTTENESTYVRWSIDGTAGGERRLILCDTRAWQAQHGRIANILTADGGVKEIMDLNGDGLFNPGFAAPKAGVSAAENGFTDGVVEINAAEIYTGCLLTLARYCCRGDWSGFCSCE